MNSLGPKAELMVLMALMGVGNTLDMLAWLEKTDGLLSGLVVDAVDAVWMVEPVWRSSSVRIGRPCGGSMRSGWPRYRGPPESRRGGGGMGVFGYAVANCGMPYAPGGT